MRRHLLFLSLFGLVAACNMDPTGKGEAGAGDGSGEVAAAPSSAPADLMLAHDPGEGQPLDPALADDQPRPVMQMQVVLDRLGFTPGVVDGRMGLSTRNAIKGFQEATGLNVTGEADETTSQALERYSNIPATRVVTIPADFAAGPFYQIPKDAAEQAKLPSLTYASLDEKLAERFHTTIETLRELNPGGMPSGTGAASSDAPPEPASQNTGSAPASEDAAARPVLFHAGQQIRVPNIGGDAIDPAAVSDSDWRQTLAMLGVGTGQPKAAKIVVSKSQGTLKAFDDGGKLIGMYTATMGSTHDPLPLGKWKILGVAHNPPFHYNPKLFWDVSDSKSKQTLPPGPNGPVGVVWIDLSKPHYGIHGTPEPQTIGRAQSHGCVRLTNWDAARLAQMVSSGTEVLFEA